MRKQHRPNLLLRLLIYSFSQGVTRLRHVGSRDICIQWRFWWRVIAILNEYSNSSAFSSECVFPPINRWCQIQESRNRSNIYVACPGTSNTTLATVPSQRQHTKYAFVEIDRASRRTQAVGVFDRCTPQKLPSDHGRSSQTRKKIKNDANQHFRRGISVRFKIQLQQPTAKASLPRPPSPHTTRQPQYKNSSYGAFQTLPQPAPSPHEPIALAPFAFPPSSTIPSHPTPFPSISSTRPTVGFCVWLPLACFAARISSTAAALSSWPAVCHGAEPEMLPMVSCQGTAVVSAYARGESVGLLK